MNTIALTTAFDRNAVNRVWTQLVRLSSVGAVPSGIAARACCHASAAAVGAVHQFTPNTAITKTRLPTLSRRLAREFPIMECALPRSALAVLIKKLTTKAARFFPGLGFPTAQSN